MKNNEVKNHFLYVFQQKTSWLHFSSYTTDALIVKQNLTKLSKSFSTMIAKLS